MATDLSASCSSCGRTLPADAPGGLCARCVLARALIAEPEPEPEPAGRVGGCTLVRRIARGGMGVVFEAKDAAERSVALKMLMGGAWASDDERARFRAETRNAADLVHPHIVPIYEVGEHEGQPYYTMRLMKQSLADRMRQEGLAPDDALRLLRTTALAVHHGHQRGVVHRDLKPENILLDDVGSPYVADFGLSRSLKGGPEGALTTEGAILGTPGYMAPEQAGGISAAGHDITVKTDVWGLGAVLYEAVCGRPPFQGTTAAEVIRKLIDDEPPRPRALTKSLHPDVEAVVLKCLEKRPERRYESAAELAADLDAILAGEPVSARRPSRVSRVTRFLRRHPVGAGALSAALSFLLALAFASTAVADAQQREMRADEMVTNAWVARAMAGAVQSELRELADAVETAARHPALLHTLETGADDGAFVPPVRQPFDSFVALDVEGRMVARWPSSTEQVGRDFSFRDYFQGAVLAHRAGRRHAVSRAYRSEAVDTYRFSISAPVTSSTGALRGVLAGNVESDSALGSLVLHADGGDEVPRDGVRRAMLVALRDRDRSEETQVLPNDWVVLLDEAILRPGEEVVVQSPVLDAIAEGGAAPITHDAHTDPRRPGTWLAGFAPVPGTRWVVIVETREDAAVARNASLAERVRRAAVIASLLGLLVGAVSFALARGRRSG